MDWSIDCSRLIGPIIFFLVNVVMLLFVWWRNQKNSSRSNPPEEKVEKSGQLNPGDILEWEYGYARTTASEAMQDRHTMVNYYLIIVAVVSSGVIAVLGQDITKVAANLPTTAGTILLWLLASVGSLYFLKIVRLREAWYESVQAMGEIKEFYIQHSEGLNGKTLRDAFFFRPHTPPAPNKRWNVFFYSAMLIALLNGVAYTAGGILIVAAESLSNKGDEVVQLPISQMIVISLFGISLFFIYGIFYDLFLKPKVSD